jgi:hypothetical protein
METTNQNNINVEIKIGISKLLGIDTLKQNFNAEVLIQSEWFLENENDTSSWDPKLYLENAVSETMVDKSRTNFFDEASKRFKARDTCKIKGLFWENLELASFPLVKHF